MSARVAFTKMVGTGNDFIIVDARRQRLGAISRQWPAAARALCRRQNGIGADGILVLETSRKADVRMRIFNADGSEAEMCGNGARCVALYEAAAASPGSGGRRVAPRAVTIETKAGTLSATVRGEQVAMRMTEPTGFMPELSVDVDGTRLRLGFVNTGVPHALVPVQSVDAVNVERTGRSLRRHRQFAPQGTNVNFVQADAEDRDAITVRTYERGVEAETLACGTGATAAAVMHAVRQGLPAGNGSTHARRIGVRVRSGDTLYVSMRVRRAAAGLHVTDVVLEGPARRVFEGAVMWPLRRD